MGSKPVKDGEQTTAITVLVPVKRRDLQVTTIERSQELQQQRYTVLPHVIPPRQLAAARRSPEPEDKSPWSLYLQPPGSSTARPLPTSLGGAVLYFGREVTHHRELLTAANFSRHWFFFYVAERFVGSLD